MKKKKALESVDTVSVKWSSDKRQGSRGRKRKQVKFIAHRRETIDTVQRKKEVGLLYRDININVATRTKLTAVLNIRTTAKKKGEENRPHSEIIKNTVLPHAQRHICVHTYDRDQTSANKYNPV